MITPYFNLNQTPQYVIVHIKIPPYQQFGDDDIEINNNTMIYHSHPYFLSLTFNNDIANDGSEKAEIDREKCELRVFLPKMNVGEVFPDLDMLPLFLTKPKTLSQIEVVSTKQNADYIPEEVHPEMNNNSSGLIQEVNVTNKMHESTTNTNEKKPTYGGVLEFNGSNDLLVGEEQHIRSEEKSDMGLYTIHYGFNNQHEGFFKDLQQSSKEIVMLDDPDHCEINERRKQRIEEEKKAFDKDHYIADTFELENEEEIMNKIEYWWSKNESEWMNDERDEFVQIPKLEVITTKIEEAQLYRDLFTIIYGYVYDQLVMGDSTVETSWVIATLSPVLSYFDYIDDDRLLIQTLIRRTMIYPLIRNYDICIKALKETVNVMKGKRVVLMRMLLRIHRLFKYDDMKHYLCYLFFDEFCVFIQNGDDAVRNSVIDQYDQIIDSIEKDELLLPLRDAEQEYIDYIKNLDDMSEENDDGEKGYLD